MKRNYNIKRTSFVCVALLSAALPGVAKKKQVRPNVVFIYADDFRIRAREYVDKRLYLLLILTVFLKKERLLSMPMVVCFLLRRVPVC